MHYNFDPVCCSTDFNHSFRWEAQHQDRIEPIFSRFSYSLSILLALDFPHCKTKNEIHFLTTTRKNKKIIAESISEGAWDSIKRSKRGKTICKL